MGTTELVLSTEYIIKGVFFSYLFILAIRKCSLTPPMAVCVVDCEFLRRRNR
jgi:hypothetical protein